MPKFNLPQIFQPSENPLHLQRTALSNLVQKMQRLLSVRVSQAYSMEFETFPGNISYDGMTVDCQVVHAEINASTLLREMALYV